LKCLALILNASAETQNWCADTAGTIAKRAVSVSAVGVTLRPVFPDHDRIA
jgi:hypothetical protein